MSQEKQIMARKSSVLPLFLLVVTMFATTSATAGTAKPSIILVHGAFADATGWQKVIRILEKDGYKVTAVQNALVSVADDVANTRRLLDAQSGPVVLVGHSYGGVVITDASAGATNVKALVYIAAFAPDAGEILGELNDRFGPSLLGTALVPDTAGFLYIDRAKFRSVFAADVPAAEASVMGATQKPVNSKIFATVTNEPGWRTHPSWYSVATEDRAIKAELQRFMAARIRARTSEVHASHVSFVSQPKEIARVIEAAATQAP
jgi:pimeloyl-ACP methyl ester carboxylesterase